MPHTVSHAWTVGGTLLLRGKVSDLWYGIAGGGVRGSLALTGLKVFAGRQMEIEIRDECLIATEGGCRSWSLTRSVSSSANQAN